MTFGSERSPYEPRAWPVSPQTPDVDDADVGEPAEAAADSAGADGGPDAAPAGGTDVSRETGPAGPGDVSRETGSGSASGDVSRETSDTPTSEQEHELEPEAAAELAPEPEPTPGPTPAPESVTEPAPPAAPPGAPPGPWPSPSRRRVMAVANQKGGVGKTTSTVNLAAALALHGVRVLVVDLDPQGNASTAFDVPHDSKAPSIYDVLSGERSLAEVCLPVTEIPNLWCAPATVDLAGAEIELVSVVARETRLRRALDSVADLDYVFIDCPPSLGLLTLNAMVAASEVLIPIQCEFYALEGLAQLLSNVQLVKTHLNAALSVSTILLTMYDARTRLADQVAMEVRSHFGDLVLDAVIPRSVRISEAPGFGQPVVTFDPASRGALTYTAAAYDLARRGNRTAHAPASPSERTDRG